MSVGINSIDLVFRVMLVFILVAAGDFIDLPNRHSLLVPSSAMATSSFTRLGW